MRGMSGMEPVSYTHLDVYKRQDDALLDTLAHTPHVVPYLDLPLQHINARLLRAMNRRGSPEYIRALVEKCHALGITLRTTMIVGFPGETEEEFEELLDFVDEAQFDQMCIRDRGTTTPSTVREKAVLAVMLSGRLMV